MDLKQRLGERIKELRLKYGYTQEQLAELVDIATKTQSYIETGRSYPESKNIEAYAKIFNIDVANILDIHSTKDIPTIKQEIMEMIPEMSNEEIRILHKFLKSFLM